MNNLNDIVSSLFHEQVSNWELARVNYEGLKTVRTKTFPFGDYDINVQFNPARIVSSGAKMDAKTIAERKCFLCTENLPAEQKSLDAGDYTILVNPFPIFPQHFTIPRKEHIDQQIKPYFTDLLELAEAMDEYALFYNGPKCGASAPDHMHFQAGTKSFLPLLSDYKRLKPDHAVLLDEGVSYQLYNLLNYGRTVYCIESDSISSAQNLFENLFTKWQEQSDLSLTLSKGEGIEPMMNIVCSFEDGIWYTFIFPRKAFRPWQFTAEGDKQLMVSPATVELCGIFITPVESHFERIKREDVVSILEQCS
jgi:ATP adenylyltransferase/5',5'''-P-1,P-4-tetraphosphate phosphorylase II